MSRIPITRNWTVAALLLLLLLQPANSPNCQAENSSVFESQPAEPEPWLTERRPAKTDPLRRLTVEERVGIARSGELVRVPVFFHPGECKDPAHLAIYSADDVDKQSPLPYQADDIRRAANGDIARMHVYFITDLKAWQQKQFLLFREANPSGKLSDGVKVEKSGKLVTLAGEDLKVTFCAEGALAGILTAIESRVGKVHLPHSQLAPRLVLTRQSGDLAVQRSTSLSYLEKEPLEVRHVGFGTGPLFGKFSVTVGRKGIPDSAEFIYIIPRNGDWFLQRQRLFAEDADTDSGEVVGTGMNHLLQGRLLLGDSSDEQSVIQVPAGLRNRVRSVHGYSTPAIINPASKLSLMPIPCVQTAVPKIEGGIGPEGYTSIVGPSSFKRTNGANSNTLHSFWTEVRYLFSSSTDSESLWKSALPYRQPLVAVVDEPWLTRNDLQAIFADMMGKVEGHHSIGWNVDSARLYTSRRHEEFVRRFDSSCARAQRQDREWWLDSARKAYEKVSEGGKRKVDEFSKGKASGPLDPWTLTYDGSSLPVMARFVRPSSEADQICRAISEAQREFNGRTDAFGFPYIDCFHSAFNMQVGSILTGLHAGHQFDDHQLSLFYRDCARTPSVLSLYGHGERTYGSLRSEDGGNSDILYQWNSDYFLRMAEICTGEDLWLHPIVHGRYLDMVDVNSDLVHRGQHKGNQPSWHRANFMRGQCHDHRWEAWSIGPFVRLLKADDLASSHNSPVGITEACYFANRLKTYAATRWNVNYVFMADIAIDSKFTWPKTTSSPPLPSGTTVNHNGTTNTITWQKVRGEISGYRIYRAAKKGGPWKLLNSPYTKPAGKLVQGTSYTDPNGAPDDVYFVTALDKYLRESDWFPDEP